MKRISRFLSKKYYFKFIFYIFIFSLLAFTVFFIDKNIQDTIYNDTLSFSNNFLNRFLIMMISSVITITTITFSIIMVVLTLYSGQFSPRTLNDFLKRKVPLNILGFFIGVSVFSLVSLILIESYSDFLFSNLTLISVLLFILSIIFFAFFIYYVSKSIQVNYYINALADEAVLEIEKYQKAINENPKIRLERSEKNEKPEFTREYRSKRSGYLVEINKKKLLDYLKEKNIFISVAIFINEHVYEEDVLFNYHTSNKNFQFDEDTIIECFIFSNEIGNFGEYRNKTKKLTEIAVRALSPGTNDPSTAISCINQLGFVFMKLSDSHYNLYYLDDDQVERLIIRTLNYNDLLYDHFYQIYLYGKQDFMILSSALKAFTRIANESNKEMKTALWQFSNYILKDLDLKKLHEFDFKEISFQLKELAYVCGNVDEYKQIME